MEDDLEEIGTARVIDGAAAGQRRMRMLQPFAVPIMVTGAGALKQGQSQRSRLRLPGWRAERGRSLGERRVGRDSGFGVALLGWNGTEIGRHGTDILGSEEAQAVLGSFRHAARCGATPLSMSLGQIVRGLRVGPRTDAGLAVRGNVVGFPAGRHGAGQLPAATEREQKVPRGVTLSAMAEPLHEIRHRGSTRRSAAGPAGAI
ncbi:MAG: hypothetical protein JWP20_2108 [Roseomonas sp.]|nr:hypothetical protein [Roseomonas sp.]